MNTSDERTALNRAVVEQPDDDTVRLVFADWLEEHGEGERAELIRLQVWHGQNWPTHELRKGCRCKSCRTFRRCTEILCLANRVKWAGPAWAPCCKIRWYRGFIETIELPVDQLEPHAAAIFAEHPVTAVKLVDAVPSLDSMVGSTRRAWYLADKRNPETCDPMMGYIPIALFGELARMSTNNVDAWNLVLAVYPNEESAMQEVENAAVILGRKQAKLPAMPIRIVGASKPVSL